jgi:S1-C subfamily serine protease
VALGIALAGLAIEARAREARRPLDYHATVLNNGIVGSAFAIAEGVAVTNAHVVRGLAPGAAVQLSTAEGAGARATAWLLAVSPRMDMALLRTPAGLLLQLPAADVPASTGMGVMAAGIDASGGGPGPRLELAGRVVAPAADLPAFGPGLIAWLPGVRPGFSGGPMLDGAGRLVGMVTAIRPGDTAAASGFAPGRARPAEEAYVLRARELRVEAARLLAATGP